jgi:hypothetical protein
MDHFDSTDFVGSRIVHALRDLPGFEACGEEVIETATGRRIKAHVDDDGRDYGEVDLTQRDGSTDQLPGHHFLDEAIRALATSRSESDKIYERLRNKYNL